MAGLRRYVTFLESMGGVRDSYREARDELRARNKQAWELKTALGAIGAAPVRPTCAFQHCTDHHLPHQLCVVT